MFDYVSIFTQWRYELYNLPMYQNKTIKCIQSHCKIISGIIHVCTVMQQTSISKQWLLWDNYYCRLHNGQVPWWSPSKIKVILIIKDLLIEDDWNYFEFIILERWNEHIFKSFSMELAKKLHKDSFRQRNKLGMIKKIFRIFHHNYWSIRINSGFWPTYL